jgi:hypothetical protein
MSEDMNLRRRVIYQDVSVVYENRHYDDGSFATIEDMTTENRNNTVSGR